MDGFVMEIVVPAGNGPNVYLVALNPPGTQYGTSAVYSDNTIRNEAGDVLSANAGLVATAAENISGRQANGVPWPVKSTDRRDPSTAGGVAVGEQPRTEPLFVPGVRPYEPVYDNSDKGGWGAPIAIDPGGTGWGSSMSRRDDRWIWPDGTITDAQRTVLGRTSDPSAAARELLDRGATPSITWTGVQVVYTTAAPAPGQITTAVLPGGATVTTDGTGRVVSSSPPGGTNVQTLTSPAAPAPVGWSGTEEGAGSPAPIYTVQPGAAVTTPVLRSDGAPNTDSTPGSGFGTTTEPVSGVEVVGQPVSNLSDTGSIGVPRWALYLAAAVGLALLLGRR